jgi:hypothetical protein
MTRTGCLLGNPINRSGEAHRRLKHPRGSLSTQGFALAERAIALIRPRQLSSCACSMNSRISGRKLLPMAEACLSENTIMNHICQCSRTASMPSSAVRLETQSIASFGEGTSFSQSGCPRQTGGYSQALPSLSGACGGGGGRGGTGEEGARFGAVTTPRYSPVSPRPPPSAPPFAYSCPGTAAKWPSGDASGHLAIVHVSHANGKGVPACIRIWRFNG